MRSKLWPKFNLQASKRESPGACLLRRCYLYVLKQQHPPSAGALILVPALADSQRWAIYTGLTKRRLPDEWLRWLSERGSQLHGVGGKNRPVLLHDADGSTITEREAKALGAVCCFVASSQRRTNTSRLEAGLQALAHGYGQGARLHRVVDAGASGIDPDETVLGSDGVTQVINPACLSKVFLTCLPVTA